MDERAFRFAEILSTILHESKKNPSPKTNSIDHLDVATINISAKFQKSLVAASTAISTNSYKDLLLDIKNAIIKKTRLCRIYSHTRDPDAKKIINKQAEKVCSKLQKYHEDHWQAIIENLKLNDQKVYKINRKLILKTTAI